jgi:plasmid stabilization system protein ParE
MSQWQLIWSPEALLDLSEHFEFLQLKNPEAAGKAVQAIRDVGFSIAQRPYRGRLLNDGSDRRKLRVPFGREGFVIHYLLENNTVLIVRIYHARQDRPT